jgi:ankyrin repeat protein
MLGNGTNGAIHNLPNLLSQYQNPSSGLLQNRTSNNRTAPQALNNQTKKLFKAIEDENLENFKQALREGANVNAFDEDGLTPLMSLANIYITSNNQPILKKIAKLLAQEKNIDINAQSKQPIYEQRQKKDHYGRPIYSYRGQEVAQLRCETYVYCRNQESVIFNTDESQHLSSQYDGVMESVITSNTHKDTALHLACQNGAQDIVKILLASTSVESNITNNENKTPKDCVERGSEHTIKLEFKKAQKGKELLNALSDRNIAQAKTLLSQEFNPNCWKRNQAGEIETPFSLIIKSCLQGITADKKEILIKLLQHKDLDFSQIKPMPEIDSNTELKQIIEQALKEKLIAVINSKDLDNVKALVEDNCLVTDAIVIDSMNGANNPISEPIQSYLNEKFAPCSAAKEPICHNVEDEANDDLTLAKELQQLENIKDELRRTETQLAKKWGELTTVKLELDKKIREASEKDGTISRQQESIVLLTSRADRLSRENNQLSRQFNSTKEELTKVEGDLGNKNSDVLRLEEDLKQARQGRSTQQSSVNNLNAKVVQLTKEKTQLRTQNQDLSNKNKKFSEASNQRRKQGNYASAFFVLSGVLAVGACLTLSNPEICISLASVSLIFLVIGCCCLYKANTTLNEVKIDQLTKSQVVG